MAEGLAEINGYLGQLLSEDVISREEYFDSNFTRRLESTIQRRLESELTGDETSKEVRELARAIVDGEIE